MYVASKGQRGVKCFLPCAGRHGGHSGYLKAAVSATVYPRSIHSYLERCNTGLVLLYRSL